MVLSAEGPQASRPCRPCSPLNTGSATLYPYSILCTESLSWAAVKVKVWVDWFGLAAGEPTYINVNAVMLPSRYTSGP